MPVLLHTVNCYRLFDLPLPIVDSEPQCAFIATQRARNTLYVLVLPNDSAPFAQGSRREQSYFADPVVEFSHAQGSNLRDDDDRLEHLAHT